MHILSFQIRSCPESNDSEIRPLIDGEEVLGHSYLGLDPPEFFAQPNLVRNGELLIGRCDCGVVGCCDYPVDVTVTHDKVTWTNSDALHLEFNKGDYEKAIHLARNDHSWENTERRVERLVADMLKNTRTKDKYVFEWASARIKGHTITLSYSKDGHQKLLEFNWDGKSDQNAVTNARIFIDKGID